MGFHIPITIMRRIKYEMSGWSIHESPWVFML